MTEKIARRGVRTPTEYMADALDQVFVRDIRSTNVVALRAEQTVAAAREWIASGAEGSSHQGFPVLNERGALVGVVTRKDLLASSLATDGPLSGVIAQVPRFVYEDCTARQAANHMVNHDIGRLPVVGRGPKAEVLGMVTRSDILSVFQRHASESERQAPTIRVPGFMRSMGPKTSA